MVLLHICTVSVAHMEGEKKKGNKISLYSVQYTYISITRKEVKKNTILLYDTIKLCFRYFLDGVGFRWRRR